MRGNETLKSLSLFILHTQNRYQKKSFHSSLCPIVERLVCSLMTHCQNIGNKPMVVRIEEYAFKFMHIFVDKKTLHVYGDSMKNGGPRKDTTRVGYASVVRRQAVD